MKRIAVVTATRPDVIKLAPVIKALEDRVDLTVHHTSQHTDLCAPLFEWFGFQPTAQSGIGEPTDSANYVSHLNNILVGPISRDFRMDLADLVIVLGDTTSALGAALAAFNVKTPVLHVEAGLRTHNRDSPWPEEVNRQLIGRLATYHACPTLKAMHNLLDEDVDGKNMAIIGQTSIDALKWTLLKQDIVRDPQDMVLITMHRRENQEHVIEAVADTVLRLVREYPDTDFLWPIHPNPAVKAALRDTLAISTRFKNLRFTQPLNYQEFAKTMAIARLIITDSGGIQEEATWLGVPFIVARDTTERPEAIDVKAGVLAGRGGDTIYRLANELLSATDRWYDSNHRRDIYGDGHAAAKLVPYMAEWGLL